jgi:hypothetical protein
LANDLVNNPDWTAKGRFDPQSGFRGGLHGRAIGSSDPNDPCKSPCAPLNASINACATGSDLMGCLCNNLQFTGEAQTCYSCYKAQGNQDILQQISTFLSLCGGMPGLSTGIPDVTSAPNSPNVVGPSAIGTANINTNIPTAVTVPGVTPTVIPVPTPNTSPTQQLTGLTGAPTSNTAKPTTNFVSAGSKHSSVYLMYVALGVLAMLGL